MKTPKQPLSCVLKTFEQVPDLYLILSPELVILTASETYLKATYTKREEITGKHLFDVFPDNPMARAAHAVKNLSRSLQQVLATRQPHRMAIQHYDVPNAAKPGGFAEKYWLPLNTPVLDKQGQVQYIIHKVEDVTEKILTENKLAREFRHLKDAQAIGHIGSFERLLSDNIITCSNEWYRLHGLEPQSEVITLDRMYSFLHPEDRHETLEAIQHTLTAGMPLHLVSRIIRADGAVRYVQRRAEILKDEQGQPYKVYGTVQDVTEQVEALKKAEDREALLRATEEVANLGSYELEVATLAIRFSDGLYRLFGEEPQAFVPSPAFVDERSHPDDVQVMKAVLEQAIQNTLPYHYTCRIRRTDGAWRILEVQGRVECAYAGRAIKLIGLVQDVTERVKADQELKQSRELLKTTIDSSLDMIQVFEAIRNESGEIIDFRWILNNQTSEKIYGDVVGKNLLEQNPGVVEVGIFDTFKKVVETGIPDQTERHYVHEQFDGWFYQSTVKLGDGVATTTRDITNRKKAEQELLQSKTLLQNIIDAPNIGITVYKVIRNGKGEIVDFVHEYINRASKAMLGEDYTGKLFTDHGENALLQMPQFIEVMETCRGNGYIREADFRGKKVWFAITNSPLHGDRLVHTWEDVTQNKEAEQRLKESKALFQSVLNNTSSSIMLLKPIRNEENVIVDFQYTYTNEQTLKSVQRSTLVGKYFSEEFPEVRNSALFRSYVQVMETGEKYQDQVDIALFGFPVWAQVYARRMEDVLLVTYFDVTERKKAEQELQESKDLLQTVFDVSLNPIAYHKAVRDESGRIVDFEFQLENREARQYALSDRTGKLYTEAYPGIKDTIIFKKYSELVETGEKLDTEVQVSLKGADRWFHLMAVKLGDGLVATALDITERKKAEQAIKESKELLESILNTLPKGLTVFEAVRDEQGQVVDLRYMLRNGYKIKGDEVDHLKGKLQTEAHPGTVSTGIHEKLKQVVQTGVNADFEVHYQYEGMNAWLRVIATRFRDGVIAFTEDITERKKAQEEIIQLKDEIAQKATDKYQTLFNTIEEGLAICCVVWDDKGNALDLRYQEFNRALEQQTGLARSSIIGRKLSEVLPKADAERWISIYRNTAVSGKPITFEEYTDLLNRWYVVSVYPKGEELSIFYRDITDHKQYEQKQDFLLRLNDALRPLSDPIEVQRAATKVIGEYLGVDRAYYCDIEPDYEHWVVADNYVRPGVPPHISRGRINDFGWAGEQLTAGKMLCVSDVNTDPNLNESARAGFQSANITATLCVPLMKEGRWVANLALQYLSPHEWSDAEIKLAEETAERTWAAVERAKAEEALAISEEKYRTLFNSMDEGYCIIQMLYDDAGKPTDFRYLQVNQAFERNTGLQDAEGKTIRELAPDIEPKWMEIYDQVAQTGSPLRFEEDSVALHHIFSLYAFRIGDPAELKVAVIFTDITERKLSQEALRKSEEQFRFFVTASSDIIYKMSADWSRMQMLTGKGFLPDTQKPNDFWVEVYIPKEDRALVRAAIQEVIHSKSTFELEHRVNKADGTVGWVLSHAIPVMDEQGNVLEWFGTASDITLRKQAEQKLHDLNLTLERQVAERTHELNESKQLLQTVFDTTQIQISILEAVRDEQGNILDFRIELVNKELERETGRKDLVGKLYAAEYPGIKTAGLFDIMLEVMETGRPKGMEYVYTSAGFDKWFSCMFVRLQDGLLATNLDITERKHAEIESLGIKLKQQKELLIAILEAQEEERSRISESLHNGIAQILYAAKLNLDELARKVPKEYTQKIQRFLKEAIEETRRVSHELVPLVLKDFGLERAIVEMCRQLQCGQLQLECEVESLETRLEFYQELALYRVSQELVNNIIKHSKATEAKLLLYQEDGLIHLKVRDNGIGMEGWPKKQKGIGLRSIEDRIELLNGSFNISKPASGAGTQVTIAIPIKM